MKQSQSKIQDEETLSTQGAASSLFAVIVAGGSGLRAGGGLPKQFHTLLGKQVMAYAVEAFLDVCPKTAIVIVTHPDYREYAERCMEEIASRRRCGYRILNGGASRAESVRNGLECVPRRDDVLVAVHDAARPLVTPALIRRGWEAARHHDAAVCCVPPVDSLRHILDDGESVAVDRSRYLAVQTPQVFRASLLKDAYSQPLKPVFTDDASVVEAYGAKVAVFEGEPYNTKITSPFDFETAEIILRRRAGKGNTDA